MPVSAGTENVTAMAKRLDVLMLRFPWVQMVVFSELCAFGPVPKHAQPMPGPAETAFCEMAARHRVWLIPGSIFERRGSSRRRILVPFFRGGPPSVRAACSPSRVRPA